MDIFKQPPSISEDTLQFKLYFSPDCSDKAFVTASAAGIHTFVDEILPDFIWHRDAFALEVIQNQQNGEPRWFIQGIMRIGDCIDDEWCTVWLLKEISGKWDVLISVFDTDGEFLLIEAADNLPSWVKPTNTANRVWIYNSRLHLVPIVHMSSPATKGHQSETSASYDNGYEDDHTKRILSLEDATVLVRDPLITTIAPKAVETSVWKRISGYPAMLRNHVHTARAYIPIDIVKALAVHPSLIQKAVEIFYTRDALQLNLARRMSRFPPQSSVFTSVRMTRTAYAQLVGQKFFPPKVFGNWTEHEQTPEWRYRDIGMKIAVGFEILFQESNVSKNAPFLNPECMACGKQATIEALRRDPEYHDYIRRLISLGYFGKEAEGSEKWRKLEEKATDLYLQVREEQVSRRIPFAKQVDAAMLKFPEPFIPLLDQGDSDDWLNVDLKHLSSETESVQEFSSEIETDGRVNDPEDTLASGHASKLKDFADKVEEFVENKGSFEGALFEDEKDTDDDLDSDSDTEGDEVPDKSSALETLVPAIDPSEYGKMPTYLSSTVTQRNHRDRMRPPILTLDRYDGVDSDDDTDTESKEGESGDEDQPQIVGGDEIDMDEEEAEFVEFSKTTLGITDDQWNDIIQDRKSRGAFLPASVASLPSSSQSEQNQPPVPKAPSSAFQPDLDSFEAVMEALEEELERHHQTIGDTKKISEAHKKEEYEVPVDGQFDIDKALEAEISSTFEPDDSEEVSEDSYNYTMIRNFLESFKSQGGLPGPVSNLAGRLQPDWHFPRDESGVS